MEILGEEDYRANIEKYGDDFKAMMGAEAIQELIKHLDVDKLIQDLRDEIVATRAKQKLENSLSACVWRKTPKTVVTTLHGW